MTPKLYVAESSPPVRSTLITAAAIGLELEKQDLDLLTGEQLRSEFVKLNPQHTVPTLVDGDYVLWDSHAINPYLVSKYAKDDSLYPKDIQRKATVDNRLHYNNATIYNTLTKTLSSLIRGEGSITEEQVQALEEIYSLLNKFLEKTKFIADDSLTVADFSVISMISSMEYLVPIDEAKFPKLVEWAKKVKELPCYAVSLPGLRKFQDFVSLKLKRQ